MKKVLIGVGIGCGLLVVIVGVVLVGGAMWVGDKVEGLAASGEQMQKHEDRAQALNDKFAFSPPPAGQPLALEEDRVKDYLAVRAALTPVLKKLEAEGTSLKHLDKPGAQADFGDLMKAGGMMMDLMTTLQGAWLDALESKSMSPREFHAITAALITADVGKNAGQMKDMQRQVLEQAKAALEQQASNEQLPEESRAEVKKELAEIEAQLAALPAADEGPSEGEKIHAQNAELFAKYKQEYEEKGNPGIDAFLWSTSGGNAFGEAMQNAMQPIDQEMANQ